MKPPEHPHVVEVPGWVFAVIVFFILLIGIFSLFPPRSQP
jgi:hypothetical protein